MPNKIDLENKIMEKVLSGEVRMKPRWYFVLGSILSFIGVVGLIVGAVFLTNLTLFLLRKQGPGTGRINIMLESFPLWVPILAVLFVFLGIWMLKRYDFSYKKNFLKLVVILVIAIILAAQLIDLLGLNDIWSRKGPMRRFYSSGSANQTVPKHRPVYNK